MEFEEKVNGIWFWRWMAWRKVLTEKQKKEERRQKARTGSRRRR